MTVMSNRSTVCSRDRSEVRDDESLEMKTALVRQCEAKCVILSSVATKTRDIFLSESGSYCYIVYAGFPSRISK
jgi:hypothetical protein